MPTDYHHGDLPAALVESAAVVLAERGPTQFSLREVARRAGVSHAAPSHHFGDSRGLLSAVASEGFQTLADNMNQATANIEDPVERLRACGRAYMETAQKYPGHYAVMMADECTDPDHAELQVSGANAFAALLDTVELLRDTLRPDLDVPATATLLWAGVHGLVELLPHGEQLAEKHTGDMPSVERLLEHWANVFIDGVRPR